MPRIEQTAKWACKYCTYENWPSATKCTLCRKVRPHVNPATSNRLSTEDIYGASSRTNDIIPTDRLICPTNDKNNLPRDGTDSEGMKWTCHICTYDNWLNSKKCTMCYAPKTRGKKSTSEPASERSKVRSPPLGRSKPASSVESKNNNNGRVRYLNIKWLCSECTYENWPKAKKCIICQHPKSVSVEDISGNDLNLRNTAPSMRAQSAISNDESAENIQPMKAGLIENDHEGVKQLRNRMKKIDWMWLSACVGIVEGDIKSVESYLTAGGDHTRQLTREEVALLNRPGVFEIGYTLVHLAVKYQHDSILAVLLTPDVASHSLKRTPSHVSPELAADIRKQVSQTLRQRKGDWPCYFMTDIVTFVLPGEISDLSFEVQRQLLDDVLDREVQKVLEYEAPITNWSEELTEELHSRVYPLWNRSAGDCLLDSILQATWGIFDRDNVLRKALYESLSEGAARFFPRWKEWEAMQANTMQYTLDEDQWEQDWTSILSLASQPGTSLEQMHVFALAHILRRPIIIYAVKIVKSYTGESLDLARFEGVYLPLLWETSFCWKNPIALGYTRGHFSALVAMEPNMDHGAVARGNSDSNEDSHDVYLPLVDHEGRLLPVHFLTATELGGEEHLLRQWLDCCVTESGILVSKQKVSPRPALVNQLTDEWLSRYRKRNKEIGDPKRK